MSEAKSETGIWHHLDARPGLLTWIVAAGLLAFAILGLLERHLWGDTSELFWDVPVYVATMEAQARGLNPYSPEVMRGLGIPSFLTVNTPPLPTWLMGLIGTSVARAYFGTTLIVLAVSSLLAIPFCLGRLFFGRRLPDLALACAAFLVLYAGAGITSVGAANHGTILHALMIVGIAVGSLFVVQMSAYNNRLLDRGLLYPLTSLAVLAWAAWASTRPTGAARRP